METYPEIEKLDQEIGMLVHQITHYKLLLKNILLHYNVKTINEIEEKIRNGEVNEHPAYENYLDALSYRMQIKDLWEELQTLLKYLKE